MKKLFLALLAVFSIALVVAGCGGDSKPAANSGDKKVVLKEAQRLYRMLKF